MEELAKNAVLQLGAVGLFLGFLMTLVYKIGQLYIAQNDKSLALVQEAMSNRNTQIADNLKTVNEFTGIIKEISRATEGVAKSLHENIQLVQEGQSKLSDSQERIVDAIEVLGNGIETLAKRVELMTSVLMKIAKISPDEAALEVSARPQKLPR